MTALISLSSDEAQRLTQRIKTIAGSIRDDLFDLRNLVDEAKTSNAWQVLGFPSWTAYLADTLGSEPMRLGRDERRELVEYLSGEGMSTRAIAPIVGVNQRTIARDRVSGEANVSPAPDPVSPPADVDGSTSDIIVNDPVAESPRAVTGLDGKTYTTPTAPKERRSSIIDDARSAGWQLRKAVERLERIGNDDRFTKNKVEIMAALQPHLDFADKVISDL